MSVVSVPIGTKQCVPRLPDPWLERPRLLAACSAVGPRGIKFLVARADPPLPFARMHVEGRLHQLRAADLAFTLDEMSELFAQHDLVLPPDEVERLWTRTAGWAAGARLAALALASHADRDGVV